MYLMWWYLHWYLTLNQLYFDFLFNKLNHEVHKATCTYVQHYILFHVHTLSIRFGYTFVVKPNKHQSPFYALVIKALQCNREYVCR